MRALTALSLTSSGVLLAGSAVASGPELAIARISPGTVKLFLWLAVLVVCLIVAGIRALIRAIQGPPAPPPGGPPPPYGQPPTGGYGQPPMGGYGPPPGGGYGQPPIGGYGSGPGAPMGGYAPPGPPMGGYASPAVAGAYASSPPATFPGSGARLVGLAGVLQGQAFPIAAGLMLGSAGSVVVNGPIIAPQHAWVGVGPTGRFVVRDGGSAAGTYVNNQRLSPSDMRELNEGDVITLGDASCQLRFHAA